MVDEAEERMSEHKYTLALIKDAGLRDALQSGADGAVDTAVDAAADKYLLTTEIGIPLDLFDNVTRVNWSSDQTNGASTYRVASPDECEKGATRLDDLIADPRKLARGMAHLLEEDAELDLDDDDVAVLTDFIAQNDLEADASPESVPESLGLYVIQVAQALQDAADHDAWLLAVVEDAG
jgi:hypothetical protein